MENLDAEQKYKELPDTYIIFITENDYYQAGKPIYIIQNMNITLNQPFCDGSHILYVNGEYRGDSDIGKLMHDFNCIDAADMNFEILAEKTRYLKENPKGVSEMCKEMEKLRDESYAEGLEEGRREGISEGREDQARKTARNMLEQKFSLEQIAKTVEFDEQTVEKWLMSEED